MKNNIFLLASIVCLIVTASGCGPEAVDDREFLEEVRDSEAATSAGGSEAGLIEPGNESPPSIELATAQFEMGLIPDEGFTFKEMPIYNRGGTPLVIGNITTSCPCTTGKMKENTIPAGGVGTLVIKLDPAKVSGYHSRKQLTIASNDPRNPRIAMIVTATVEGEITLSEREIRLDSIEVGEAGSGFIRVTQSQEKPMEFGDVVLTGAPDFLTVDVKMAPESDWTTPNIPEFLITANVAAENTAGAYDAVAKIGISRKHVITFPVRFVIKGIYNFEPDEITVRNLVPGESQEGVTVVTSRVPLEVTDVKSLNTNMEVSFVPGAEPNSYRFDLLVPNRPPNRLQKDEWEVTMNVDGEEVVKTVKVVALLSRQ